MATVFISYKAPAPSPEPTPSPPGGAVKPGETTPAPDKAPDKKDELKTK